MKSITEHPSSTFYFDESLFDDSFFDLTEQPKNQKAKEDATFFDITETQHVEDSSALATLSQYLDPLANKTHTSEETGSKPPVDDSHPTFLQNSSSPDSFDLQVIAFNGQIESVDYNDQTFTALFFDGKKAIKMSFSFDDVSNPSERPDIRQGTLIVWRFGLEALKSLYGTQRKFSSVFLRRIVLPKSQKEEAQLATQQLVAKFSKR